MFLDSLTSINIDSFVIQKQKNYIAINDLFLKKAKYQKIRNLGIR